MLHIQQKKKRNERTNEQMKKTKITFATTECMVATFVVEYE